MHHICCSIAPSIMQYSFVWSHGCLSQRVVLYFTRCFAIDNGCLNESLLWHLLIQTNSSSGPSQWTKISYIRTCCQFLVQQCHRKKYTRATKYIATIFTVNTIGVVCNLLLQILKKATQIHACTNTVGVCVVCNLLLQFLKKSYIHDLQINTKIALPLCIF